jgi:hypothetical protein
MKRSIWQEHAILAIGVVLFFSPWLFSYQLPSPAALLAVLGGTALVVLSAFQAIGARHPVVYLALIGVGIATALAPWMMPLAVALPRSLNSLVGITAALLAFSVLRSEYGFGRGAAPRPAMT